MVIKCKFIIKTVALFLFFNITTTAQFIKNPEQYPVFKNYKHWGIYYANVSYAKAKVTRTYGDYELKPLRAFSYSFGFEKMIHPERRFAFKMGLIMDITPFYNFSITFKPEDVYPQYNGYTDKPKDFRAIVSIPLVVEVKKQLSEHIYFNLETGLHLALQFYGDIHYPLSIVNEENKEVREVFLLYQKNPNSTWLYPNLIISPGFYFAEDWGLIQTNVIYQNTLINYFKGDYKFKNLLQSPDTGGTQKLNGDYIGISLSFHFNKTAYRNLISKAKPD